MSNTNDFVPFCNDNTGTNLLSQANYLTDPDLPIGNQPGIARSALNNKALRQGTTIAAVAAQYVSNTTTTDVLDIQNSSDHVIPTSLLAQFTATHKRLAPTLTKYLSGSGNHNLTSYFFVSGANATSAATYSDGTTTFTVSATISSGSILQATGAAFPVSSGTLTKVSGTGDATIAFYATRTPLYIEVEMIGGGSGGSGSGTTGGGSSLAGSNTTFGSSLLTANGGGVANFNGISVGGSVTVNSPAVAIKAIAGGDGSSIAYNVTSNASQPGGGYGAASPFGGAGSGGTPTTMGAATGGTAIANSGSGGGGGGANATAACSGGCGGAAGGYIQALITSPSATYAYSVGAGSSGGGAGSNGNAGGPGGSGQIIVKEYYQ